MAIMSEILTPLEGNWEGAFLSIVGWGGQVNLPYTIERWENDGHDEFVQRFEKVTSNMATAASNS